MSHLLLHNMAHAQIATVLHRLTNTVSYLRVAGIFFQ